ncbi:MAG: D-alanyl-D-alanine carboxypeptidase [Coprococcus catus]|nr:D-alanyl-D-alanine carboxypeptidase [Coprococcus catus]
MERMKYIVMTMICLICSLCCDFSVIADDAQETNKEELVLNARAAVLMDGDSGRILYEKNGENAYPMASTTKIMTLIVALENNTPDQIVTASANASLAPEVRMGVHEGEQYRMKDIYYAMMLESFNDAAVMIAEGTAGNVEHFADMMNEKANVLGCQETYFITPNGLDAEDQIGIHHSTATDMALIMRYAIRNPDFLKITQTIDYAFADCDGKRSFVIHNKNALLAMRDGVLSGKTGYTADAGYCYVCAVKSGDRTFIVSLLGSGWPPHKRYKWADVQTLLDYGEANYHYQTVDIHNQLPEEQIYVIGDNQKFVKAIAKTKTYRVLLSEKDTIRVTRMIPGFLKVPVEKGQEVGRICLYDINGNLLAESCYLVNGCS